MSKTCLIALFLVFYPSAARSEAVRKANWRDGVALPTLVTDKLYTPRQICRDARSHLGAETARRFAVIAFKNHACDMGMRACMHTLRTVSDPCNKFLLSNFVVYH